MTQYERRITFLVPAARQAAFNSWCKVNVDTNGGEFTLTVPLSPSGNLPATHFWCSGVWREIEVKRFCIRLAQLAGIEEPSGWDGMRRATKLQWFADNRAAIQSNTGIRFRVDPNDGALLDYEPLLIAAGLERVE